jgi:hypothetical protein
VSVFIVHAIVSAQYFDIVRANPRTPPSELYGVVHFTRFVSKARTQNARAMNHSHPTIANFLNQS